MIKKFTAYSFVLLVNIILLTHAIIPHHHHESVVCVKQKHCQDDALPHDHNVAKHDHQHDSNKNSTTCILKQSVIVPTTQGKQLRSCDNFTDNHSHDYYIISNFGYVDLQPVSEVGTCNSEFPSLFISFVTTSLGLRAPPIV
jgi:hypothetical protein